MRILTISDRVEAALYNERIAERFGNVELVISCGDLPLYYLEYIVTMLNVPLLYVFGNHAEGSQPATAGEKPLEPGGCINIDRHLVNYKGLLIGGLEGSMRYNRETRFQYTDQEMDRKIAGMLPALLWNRLRRGRYLDILVTHAPPCGIHDGEDLCHRGFRAYKRFIELFAPRYLIHGHSHVFMPNQPVRTIYRRTEVINTYGYRELEIEVPPRPLELAAAQAPARS